MLRISINKLFLIAYFLIIPIFWIIIKYTKDNIELKTREQQERRVGFTNHLLSSWDTLIIGNKYNENEWYNMFWNKKGLAMSSSINTIIRVELITIMSMFISFVPIVGFNVLLILNNIKSPVYLATLPRQINLIQYISQIIIYITNIEVIKIKLQEMFRVLFLLKYITFLQLLAVFIFT